MAGLDQAASLEEQIAQWRSYLRRRQAIHSVDVAELEDHLREQMAGLMDAGLAPDEAFLVAVKRMGDLDAVSREFAREHSDRLWKQLVVSPSDTGAESIAARRDVIVALGLAVAAAVAVKVPLLFGIKLSTHEGFYARNLSFFILPLLAGYFAWKRRLNTNTLRWLAVLFAAAVVAANLHPLAEDGSTEALTMLHVPIALWLIVGFAYAGARWKQVEGRMDFIRFSGEFLTYAVLVLAGGIVLTTFSKLIFQTIALDAGSFIQSWLVPCGAAAAVIIVSWLVEAKQSVIENMAPVLTRLFTPVFGVVLITFLGVLLWNRGGVDVERNMLIRFNLLLVLVLALLLYSVSARDPESPPGAFDVMQVVLLACALLAGAVALWAISARISEFGVSANRVAALGVNIILLVNLAWSAVLYIRFLRGRGSFMSLERWQTDYLTVYAVWAALVVIVFPVVFGYS